MNQRTAKRWEKRARPEEIRAAFLREVKKRNRVVWARTVCWARQDGPDHVLLHAQTVPPPWRQYMGIKQAIHKGGKP